MSGSGTAYSAATSARSPARSMCSGTSRNLWCQSVKSLPAAHAFVQSRDTPVQYPDTTRWKGEGLGEKGKTQRGGERGRRGQGARGRGRAGCPFGASGARARRRRVLGRSLRCPSQRIRCGLQYKVTFRCGLQQSHFSLRFAAKSLGRAPRAGPIRPRRTGPRRRGWRVAASTSPPREPAPGRAAPRRAVFERSKVLLELALLEPLPPARASVAVQSVPVT